MSILATDKLLSIIEKITLFGGLDPEQKKTVLALMEEREFSDGELIFKRGEPACNIYIIIEGEVGLDFEQQDHPLSDITITPGHCFGETSMIGVQPHIATTRAMGRTSVLELSGSDLYELYETDLKLFSAIIMNIAREASRRLHATDELFLQHSLMRDLKKIPYLGF